MGRGGAHSPGKQARFEGTMTRQECEGDESIVLPQEELEGETLMW